jgi:hypothetical protein
MIHRYPFVLIVVPLVLVAGCKKMSPETKLLVDNAVTASQERAAAVLAMKGTIKAKDAAKQTVISEYLDRHANGLVSDAKSLANIQHSLNEKYETKALRAALQDLATVAKARAENFAAMLPFLSDADAPWATIHSQALTQFAGTLGKIKDAVKDPEEAKKTP